MAIKPADNMVSQKYDYKKYFEPFLSAMGLTLGTNIQENHTYWYKDYASFGIRLIGIDREHWREKVKLVDGSTWDYYAINEFPDQTTVETVDTGQQHQWFVETLNGAKELGYSVIVLIHEPHQYNLESCTYTNPDYPNVYGAAQPIEVAQDVQDFINAGGNFITWLTRETHRSAFGTVRDFPDQTQCTLETSRMGYWYDGDTEHILNTESQDCLEVVSIDKL